MTIKSTLNKETYTKVANLKKPRGSGKPQTVNLGRPGKTLGKVKFGRKS